MNNTLTALKGVRVGNSTHKDKLTGCTVVLFDDFYPVAYKSYGGASGTFNTENIRTGKSWPARNGLFIAGGSLLGLASASEIMGYMIEHKLGEKDGKTIRPAISGAIVYDLGIRLAQYDPAYGREAAQNATNKPVESGNVGAGTGTSVGKFSYTKELKMLNMKAGVGSSRVDLGNGIIVCALSVVNALGNVIMPNGKVFAGNRHGARNPRFRNFDKTSGVFTDSEQNTTISIVGINVDLKEHANYETVAHMASQGHVRAISPVNTSLDGDTVFVFSTEEIKSPLSSLGKTVARNGWPNLATDIIGHAASRAVQESVYDACRQAETITFEAAYNNKVPSVRDYHGSPV